MPLQRARKGASKKAARRVVSANIHELHGGKTHAATAAKHGKAKADKQSVAIALAESRKPAKRSKTKRRPPTKAKKRVVARVSRKR